MNDYLEKSPNVARDVNTWTTLFFFFFFLDTCASDSDFLLCFLNFYLLILESGGRDTGERSTDLLFH